MLELDSMGTAVVSTWELNLIPELTASQAHTTATHEGQKSHHPARCDPTCCSASAARTCPSISLSCSATTPAAPPATKCPSSRGRSRRPPRRRLWRRASSRRSSSTTSNSSCSPAICRFSRPSCARRSLAGPSTSTTRSCPGSGAPIPHARAGTRGVKLIGATAHFVTSDRDEGPITGQNVTRVDRSRSPEELVINGRDIEGRPLSQAVRWFEENRVLLDE